MVGDKFKMVVDETNCSDCNSYINSFFKMSTTTGANAKISALFSCRRLALCLTNLISIFVT